MDVQQQIPSTRGRICLWLDMDDAVSVVTIDGWTTDHELQTIGVWYVGPFDLWSDAFEEARRVLTAQQLLF